MTGPQRERRRKPRDPAREWQPYLPWREALGVALVMAVLWANGLGAL